MRTLFLTLSLALPLCGSLVSIMPLGDSLTVADSGTVFAPGGYRNHVYENLTALGFAVQLTGSQNLNPSAVLLGAGQDRHEGHSGYLIQGDGVIPGLDENIASYLALNQPDVVILMIGTNDMNRNIDPAGAPARLGLLLDHIAANRPGVKILLSTIPFTLIPEVNVRIVSYNAAMPALAAARSNVHFFDNTGVLNLATDYGDGLHLTPAGYDKLGDAFAAQIAGLLAVPEPSTAWLMGVSLFLAAAARRNR